jgi:hypothetical protein
MDKTEALKILHSELIKLRIKSYGEITAVIGKTMIYESIGPTGIQYQIDVQVFWDDPRHPEGNIRVLASIDDGGFISSIKPLSMDFIMSPNGDFIGE